MRTHVEIGVEPALAPDPAAKRDRSQAAVEPVAPLMIDANVLLGVAGQLAPHQRAAMGAAVDKGFDDARPVSIEDNRRFAYPSRAEIAGLGDLGLEPEIIPHRTLEDMALLALVDLGIVVEAVWHPAVVERRPDLIGHHHRPGSATKHRYSLQR